MVAEATDSLTFRGDTSVGALWASLDELPNAPALTGDALRPFYIESARPPAGVEEGPFGFFLSPRYATIASPQPVRLRAALGDLLTGETSGETITDALGDYPTTAGVRVEDVERPTWFRGNPEPLTEKLLSFPDDDGRNRSLYYVGNPVHESSRYDRSARFSVRPRIGSGNDRPPSRLMTLWALVYALSQLARYHPEAWVSALNPDSSEIAVDLEHGLDAALLLVPELLVSGVTRGMMERLMREQKDSD